MGNKKRKASPRKRARSGPAALGGNPCRLAVYIRFLIGPSNCNYYSYHVHRKAATAAPGGDWRSLRKCFDYVLTTIKDYPKMCFMGRGGRRPGAGRPVSADGRTANLNVRTTEAKLAAWTQAAVRRGMTLTDLAETAIDKEAAMDSSRYIAIKGMDRGTCEQLGWAALSIEPMVVCSGDDADDVLAQALGRGVGDDVVVFDIAARREVAFRDDD